MGEQKSYEAEQWEVTIPVPGEKLPSTTDLLESILAEKHLGVLVNTELTMPCALVAKHPGLHQAGCPQPLVEGDPSPLLSPGETHLEKDHGDN